MTDDKSDPKAPGPRPVPRAPAAASAGPLLALGTGQDANADAGPDTAANGLSPRPDRAPPAAARPESANPKPARHEPASPAAPKPPQTPPPPQTPQPPRVKFDTAALKSSYCNVCNGSSTREEVVLNFGINTTWDRAAGEDRLDVALHHRIIMSPHAAKRVRDMMVRLIDEHEARYGKLDG